MTQTARSSRKVISGTGWTNPLSHAFYLENATHVKVYADDTQLVMGVDYSVNSVGVDAGYSVTITTPGSWEPDVWVLDVQPPMDQPSDTSLGGSFGARYEAALDLLALRIQRVYDMALRSLKSPLTTDPSTLDQSTLVIEPEGLTDIAGLVADAQAAAATATTQAGTATTQASAAASAAGTATSAAGTATAQAAAAAASAVAIGMANDAIPLVFSTSTVDADPGAGTLRLNNATIASATAAYVDNTDADGATISGILDTYDDSTNTVRGQLTIRSKSVATTRHVFNVTGSVVDGTGYRKLTLAYVSGSGTFTNGDSLWMIFDRTSDKGADGAGSGDVVGPASASDNAVALFNTTTGKLIKAATAAALSILGRSANSTGIHADITAGTDGHVLRRSGTTLGFGTILSAAVSDLATTITTAIAAAVGVTVQAFDAQLASTLRQNSKSAAYTLVLTDGGKHIYHPPADTTARIWTIPAHASVAYPIGTTLTFINGNGAGVITIAITSDTLRLAGSASTGSRTLAANGMATAVKVENTVWYISGSGLT